MSKTNSVSIISAWIRQKMCQMWGINIQCSKSYYSIPDIVRLNYKRADRIRIARRTPNEIRNACKHHKCMRGEVVIGKYLAQTTGNITAGVTNFIKCHAYWNYIIYIQYAGHTRLLCPPPKQEISKSNSISIIVASTMTSIASISTGPISESSINCAGGTVL